MESFREVLRLLLFSVMTIHVLFVVVVFVNDYISYSCGCCIFDDISCFLWLFLCVTIFHVFFGCDCFSCSVMLFHVLVVVIVVVIVVQLIEKVLHAGLRFLPILGRVICCLHCLSLSK